MSEEKDLEKLAKRNYGDDSHFGKTSEENWSEFLEKMKTGKISPQKEGDFEVIFHVYEILPPCEEKKEEKKE